MKLVLKVERLAICLSMVDAKGMLLFSHLVLKAFYDRPSISLRLLGISPRRKGPGKPLPTAEGSA